MSGPWNSLVFVSLILASGCGIEGQFGFVQEAVSQGSALSWTLEAPEAVVLPAAVEVSGSVTSTGSAGSVSITVAVDGGEELQVVDIDSGAFVNDGRAKSGSFGFALSLSIGSHDVQVCATQSGAMGRASKRACGQFVTTVFTELPDSYYILDGHHRWSTWRPKL